MMKRKFTLLAAALMLLSCLAVPLGMRGQTRESFNYTYNYSDLGSMLSGSYTDANSYWKVPASAGNTATINIPITHQPISNITLTFHIATFGSATKPTASNTTITAVGTETGSNWSGSGVSTYPESSTYVDGVMTITKPENPTTLGGLTVTMGVNTGVRIFRLEKITVSYTYTVTPTINISEETLQLPYTANANGSWEVTYTSFDPTGMYALLYSDSELHNYMDPEDPNSWIRLKDIENTEAIPYEVDANTSSGERHAYLYVGAYNNNKGSVEGVFTITQAGIPTHTVTYDCNGGNSGCPENATGIVHGNSIYLASEPSKTGYTFGGWNDGNTTYDAGDSYTVTNDVTMTAQWTANIHNIIISGASHGTVSGFKNPVAYGTEITLTYTHNPNEYYSATFAATGVTLEGSTFTMPDNDVTITVTETALPTYTVTYSDGGSVTEDHYGAGVTLATRSDIGTYSFDGWTTSNIPTETTTAPTSNIAAGEYHPTTDITLYPVYTRTVGGSAQEYTPSVSISNYASAHNWSNGTKYSTVTLDENITATASDGTYTGTYNSSNNDWRIYQTDGGSVTISTSSGVLSSVTFTFTPNNNGILNYNNSAVTSGTAVNVSGTSAEFTVSKTGSGSNGQIRITAIEVKYTTGGGSITYYTSGYSMPISKWTSTTSHDGWYLIAAPVGTTAATGIGNLTSNTYDLYRFNQASELEWENYKQEGDHQYFALEPGKGYLYANNTNVTLTFFDQSATNTTKDVTLTFSEDNPKTNMRGWNLIGNPFATTATIKGSNNADKPFYRMNADHTDLITDLITGNVNALEGIFVHTETDEAVVTFTKASKGAANNNDNNLVIDLSAEKGNVIDRAIVRFDEGEALPKFQIRDNSTKLCIVQDGKEYAIVSSEAQGEMPVNFRANENGQYTLTVNPENVEMNYLHLIDNMTGADIDLLANPSYSFNATTTDYESRFKLVFASDASTGSASDETFAFFSNGNWIINNAGEATLQVVDITGRILSSETVNGSVSTTINATPGVYMLRLINGENVKVQKIVVR